MMFYFDVACNDKTHCKKHSGNDGFANRSNFSHFAENEVGYKHSLCNGRQLFKPFLCLVVFTQHTAHLHIPKTQLFTSRPDRWIVVTPYQRIA